MASTGSSERLVRIEDPESGAVGPCLYPRISASPRSSQVASADIERLSDKLARMRDASVLCERTNRDGTLCKNDRRECPDHP